MSESECSKKRKRLESDSSDDWNQKMISNCENSGETSQKNVDLGDLGNTMDEMSSTDSEDNEEKKKILKRFRKKLRAEQNNFCESSPENQPNVEKNVKESNVDSLYQNQLGDPFIQNLMFQEEMNNLSSQEIAKDDKI